MRAHRIRPKLGIRREDLLILLMALADAIEDDPAIRDRLEVPSLLAGLIEPSDVPLISAKETTFEKRRSSLRPIVGERAPLNA